MSTKPGVGVRTPERVVLWEELSVCPHCTLTTTMSHHDWVRHVGACREIELGLTALRILDEELPATKTRTGKGKSA